ncbi:MAG: thioredoxin reductase [Gammaproteobacteria bacterium]|nr:thioredoxin reductase [Gammaproteobacteria bacterium]
MMTPSSPSSLIERRREQMFPVLNSTQIEIARRFGGEPRRFKPDEVVFELGEVAAPAYLVLSGSIKVSRRAGFGRMSEVTTHGPGELTGEVSQLAGGPALAQGRAGPNGAQATPFDSAQLRSLVVATADVGEAIMRAFILRRAFLIETGAGLVLLGAVDAPAALRLQNFLRRNAVPYTMLNPDTDREAASLIDHLGISKAELPLAICPDGTMLRDPHEKTLAQCLGLLPSFLADRQYDVAVVGAGPAGLATAVYAASEGLSVLVLDSQAFGGQAGASARIENYLGFPTGISGEALTGRAYTQAQKFGAVMAIPAEVKLLKPAVGDARPDRRDFELELDEAKPVRASTIVIASGARYRKLDLPNLSSFEGRGVYYWASPIESRLCARREVVVVGGGNSAGQGAVFLASHVAKIHMLVRGRSLSENMSQYLVTRIEALPNVEIHTRSELTQLIGDPQEGLQGISWRDRSSGKEEKRAIRHVFLFIGAVPNTDWLKQCAVIVDAKGFVQTGGPGAMSAAAGEGTDRGPLQLETSLQGVFAVGDVRAGSVKRVSGAVGEGAAVVAQLHGYLHAIRPEHRMTAMRANAT